MSSLKGRPPDELLKRYAPLVIWDEAVRQAQRSTFKRHRTGAVIFDGSARILGKGCSHKRDGYAVHSCHAERHALRDYIHDAHCCVVTITANDNFASCSRPCRDCAYMLEYHMINVVYAERTNDGGWAIRAVGWDMITHGYLKPTRYAA